MAEDSVRKILSSVRDRGSSYKKLPNQDIYDAEESPLDVRTSWTKTVSYQFGILALRITIFSALLIGIVLAVFSLMRTPKPISKSSEQELVSCGHTPTEARNAGCRFEPMMSAWVPELCSFPELISDTAGTFENWLFFSDENITQPIAGAELDGVRAGNYTKVFSSHGTGHDLHCLYAWRKLNFAVEKGTKFIDSKSRSLHHTTHCAKHIAQLLEEGAGFLPKDDGIRHVTAFPLLYLKCVPLVLE